jgi:succinoglycan biosynthesis transport protein ExoP
MRHALTNVPAHPLRADAEGSAPNTIDLDSVIDATKRQWKAIVGGIFTVMLAAVIYLLLATPMYMGAASILIDGRTIGTSTPQGEEAQLIFSGGAVDSQVEVIKSQNVALAVIEKLNLLQDEEFTGPSLLTTILRRLSFSSPPSPKSLDNILKNKALQNFAKRLTLNRVNKTFVLEIDFLSMDAEKAANIANAIAQAYIADQLKAKLDSGERAIGWLQDRIQELHRKSTDADLAIQKYRESKNLITTDGRLINDHQLSELSSQLSSARADSARAQAKYDQIRAIIDNKLMGAAVSEELRSPVITELRNRYLIAAKRKAEHVVRVGPTHSVVVSLEREMQGYEKQIFEELGRIAETYRSDNEVAKAREKSLSNSLAHLVGGASEDNLSMIELRKLEQAADAYRNLYQTFLQRYQELVQQQSFPTTETRIITTAIPPTSPSQPNVLVVIAASLVGGIAVGAGAAMFREYRDRVFRLSDQVRTELDLEFLGALPLQRDGEGLIDKSYPATQDFLADQNIPAVMTISIAQPLSRFADTMRTIKVEADSHHAVGETKIIGVVSAVSGEGKTTTSANLALFCGATGSKTLLIDADLRQCGLSKRLAPEATASVVEVVMGTVGLSSAARKLSTDVLFLPATAARKVANSSEILRSAGMERLLAAAAKQFEYIVIDLPPLVSLVDARAIAPFIAHFLFVVEWGKTPRIVVRDALLHNPLVHEKCLGAVLNKADRKLILRYMPGNTRHYGDKMY